MCTASRALFSPLSQSSVRASQFSIFYLQPSLSPFLAPYAFLNPRMPIGTHNISLLVHLCDSLSPQSVLLSFRSTILKLQKCLFQPLVPFSVLNVPLSPLVCPFIPCNLSISVPNVFSVVFIASASFVPLSSLYGLHSPKWAFPNS